MAAHVPDEVDADEPLHEPPLLVAAFEAVLVTVAGDGLKSQPGSACSTVKHERAAAAAGQAQHR